MDFSATKKINKIYKVVLILLIASISFTGCIFTNTSTELESGFEFSGNGYANDEMNPFFCGYKTDKTEFDIDDVRIDLYYGVDCCNDSGYLFMRKRIPDFDIYVSYYDEENNEEYVNKHLIRHVEEEYVSRKYDCDVVVNKKFLFMYTTKIIYNHHETIQIPKEVFLTEIGRISILIYHTDIIKKEQMDITETAFYYKIIGEKVMVATKPFE